MDDANPERVVDLCERVSRLQQGMLHASAMPPTQWHALRFLSRANRFSRTPGALGQYLGSTKGTISQTLIALERRGLLAKTTDPADRRVVRLDLTAAGLDVIARDPLREMREVIEGLPGEQRAALADALGGLLRGLLEMNGNRTFGVCASCHHFRRNGAGGEPGGPHRCGLLDVPLSETDAAAICLEHTPAAA